ncbi:hypothetical protein JCM8547_004009 [Rhodosporidiobolus lusitaniae]
MSDLATTSIPPAAVAEPDKLPHLAASSSLPTPPMTVEERAPSPPQSLPDSFAIPPPSSLPTDSSSSSSLPPPPLPVTLPPPAVAQLDHLPGKLMHADSSSSVAAQPPTPAAQPQPPAIAPPQFTPEPLAPPPAPPAAFAVEQPTPDPAVAEAQEQPHTNGYHEHDAPVDVPFGVHPGLGSIPHQDDISAVDILADMAMGEAALGLADFAAGAGSGDVRGGSPALPVGETAEFSPSLKRTADEAAAGGANEFEQAVNGLNGSLGGEYGNGQLAADGEEREAKRLRVEAEPAPALPAGSSVDSFPYSSAPAIEPSLASNSISLPPPLPSSAPAAVSPSPALPDQGFDPSAFTNVPTSTPSYPPASASATMSPTDLYNISSAPSPHIAPPSAVSSSLPPMPSPHSQAPTPQPLYASPNIFTQQPQASTSAGLPGLPPLQPLAQGQDQFAVDQKPDISGENGSATPVDGSAPPADAGPPPPEPVAIMTKEQQKTAINMVRNLKRNKNAPPFLKPVDAIALHIPDYYKIILNPMDLGTVEARLQATGKAMAAASKSGRIYGIDYSLGKPGAKWEGQADDLAEVKTYRTIAEFESDLNRIWENCFRYNGPREKNPVSAMAGVMQDAAAKGLRSIPFAPAISPYPPPPEKKLPAAPHAPFIPNIHRDSRPKREIHAPVKDLAYLESAGLDPTAGGIYNLSGIPGMHGGAMGMPKQRKVGQKMAQEQLRFCKEVIKELFKKVHESYAYPFYQPVDLAAYPTYLQFVKRPMDLSTIRQRLEHNQYPSPPYAAFEADVRQIFKNCYAFNPPGSAVCDWGHRLEAVFEHKWSEKPMGYDDDSDGDDPAFSVMEQQLAMMQQNLEMMRQNKKAQKEAKRYAESQYYVPPPPKPAKKPAAPQPNPYALSAYASAPPPMPRPAKKNTGPRIGGGGGGGAHTHKKKKKRVDDDSDDYYDDDDGGAYYGGGASSSSSRRRAAAPAEPQFEEYVDFEMKRELAVKIVTFQDEQLQEAINIIRRGRPELLGAADQEVELDIDQLDQHTLLSLYRYVCPDSKPAVRPITAPSGGGGARGGSKPPKQNRNQRKNLDEEKEAERIEMLEARLREFENGGGEGGGAGGLEGGEASRRGSEAGLPPAASGEGDADQASSDSSDDGSSDSDSDEE